ncbi:MAG: tRNA (guanosine(37)-N1)-methyltransferase TrmD, partial [Caldiserica bacterium]|nr:tRNA (guanosine(37)-N1)-methyltransferase TrmD [Caldisericota bacterium]
SFANNLLEYSHYTRPEEFEGEEVPEALRSGNHEKIRLWRLKESLKRTLLKRPDLILKKDFTKEEKKLLKEVEQELDKIFEEIFKK